MIGRALGRVDRWMRPRLLVLQGVAWGALFGAAFEAGDYLFAAVAAVVIVLIVNEGRR